MTLEAGLLLALASAFATNLGFLLRHRGAVAAPDVDPRRPLRSAIGLFRSKWWAIGYGVAIVAYALHVGALTLAPLSLVQAVLAAGLVLLGVLAERMFGFHLGRREWLGVVLAAAGLAFLALTGRGGDSGEESARYSVSAMIAFEATIVGIGTVLILSGRSGRAGDQYGVLLGAASGLLFTVAHVAVKALSDKTDSGILAILLSPFLLIALLAWLVAFFSSARSLQIGEAVPVIAVTSIAGTVCSIPAGVIVFGDPLGSDALQVALRSAAFVMVVAAAAMIPAPTRAAGEARRRGARQHRVQVAATR
jgi:drug/metabolite transporter (DMT)-like permease